MIRNLIFFTGLAFLIPGQVIGQPAIADQTEDSAMNLITALALSLLILVILTLWILKNSYRLKETVENPETDGEVWLNRHLRDLDTHQLEILIKRHPLMNNPALKDEKPNE